MKRRDDISGVKESAQLGLDEAKSSNQIKSSRLGRIARDIYRPISVSRSRGKHSRSREQNSLLNNSKDNNQRWGELSLKEAAQLKGKFISQKEKV